MMQEREEIFPELLAVSLATIVFTLNTGAAATS